jgi:hypothetical protein
MPSMRTPRIIGFVVVAFAFLQVFSGNCHAQAALLLEEPYGFFGKVNPTGHLAMYFARVCAETPTKLRRCEPGEMGAVIARYSDINHYDWIAMPLVPYLYSVEDIENVPSRVDREMVNRLRDEYHEAHLMDLGEHVRKGDFWHGGWTELIGVAYERRMFAFRFDTTEKQDDAFIARMNAKKNHSHFELFYNNCADFSRAVLNEYFPHALRRNLLPDAGMTTPKQIAYRLKRYAEKHPQLHLQVFEIPQVLGYRHKSGPNKCISESLVTTGYALPITILNPYLAGALLVDYAVRGRYYHLIPKNPEVLTPEKLASLTYPGVPAENPFSTKLLLSPPARDKFDLPTAVNIDVDLKETVNEHD